MFLQFISRLVLACGVGVLSSPAAVSFSEGDASEDLPEALQPSRAEFLSSGAYRALIDAKRPVDSVFFRAQSNPPQGVNPAAPLAAKVSANHWLGADPDQLPSHLRAQAEPHVIRSFTDASLVVGTFQEGRYSDTDGGAFNCSYVISHDGGRTWTRGLLPGLVSTFEGGAFDRATDPVAGVDLLGNIYVNTLGLQGTGRTRSSSVAISKSTDNGESFNKAVTIFKGTPLLDFPDKNWLAINTFAGTANANRLAVTFTYFTGTNSPIVLSYSDDAGESWSTPNFLTTSLGQGSTPVFLPNGSLAVFYFNIDTSAIEYRYSEDGGQTFDGIRVVTPVAVHKDSKARDAAYFPSVASDRQAGILYMAYQALDNGPAIHFIRSIDRGKTWTKPRRINDTPRRASVFNPGLAVSPDGQHLTVVFYDKRNDASGEELDVDLYLAESFDGGDTWETNLRVSDRTSSLKLAPQLARGYMLGDYNAIAPALDFSTPAVTIWIDTRTGTPDPFSARIARTQGATFETWRKLRFANEAELTAQASGENADPDQDGIPNLAEYGFGSEPGRMDVANLRIVTGAPENKFPIKLVYESPRVVNDLQFVWQTSTDLKQWSEVNLTEAQTGSGTDTFSRLIVASPNASSEAQRYFRLQVRKAAPPQGVGADHPSP